MKMLQLYKRNNKLWVEKEELNKEINELFEKVELTLGPKDYLRG